MVLDSEIERLSLLFDEYDEDTPTMPAGS